MPDFLSPLQMGVLLKRYKRFFADVDMGDGCIVTAHCPNTGSMKTCSEAGMKVWLQANSDPKRKLKWTWELSQNEDGSLIGVNTHASNAIVYEGLLNNTISELSGYSTIMPEVKYGHDGRSRIDFLLTDDHLPPCYLEVKNVTLKSQGRGVFPDAVTSRGKKHLEELSNVSSNGNRAVMLFLLNRSDVNEVGIAESIDPAYAEAVREAISRGVEVLAYKVTHSIQKIFIGQEARVPFVI